jgi:hypothetical protein
MKNPMNLVLATTISLLLSACSSYSQQMNIARNKIESDVEKLSAQPLTQKFNLEAAEPLQIGPKQKYMLDHNAVVTSVDGAPSYFKIFSLKDQRAPTFVELVLQLNIVASDMLSQTNTSTIFPPKFIFLDGKGAVLGAETPELKFETDRYLFVGGVFAYAEICDPKIEYIAVSTNPKLFGQSIEEVSTGYSQYGASQYLTVHYFSPIGKFRFGVPSKAIGNTIFYGGNKKAAACGS